MDDLRFDRLVQRLGTNGNRRTSLKGLAGGLLGVGVASRPEVTLGARCQRNRDCGSGERCCGNRCRDILTDPRHCGGCNNNCRGNGTRMCRNGGCFFQCRGAQAGICDLNACGDLCGCNVLDANNNVCEFVAEQCTDPNLNSCTSDSQCEQGRICMQDACCPNRGRICVRSCNPRIRPGSVGREALGQLPVANPVPGSHR